MRLMTSYFREALYIFSIDRIDRIVKLRSRSRSGEGQVRVRKLRKLKT